MNFFVENYIIIIIVGLFFVFALIGYLIDTLRKNNTQNKNEITTIRTVEVPEFDISPKNENQDEKETTLDDGDDLLKKYDDTRDL